MKPSPLNLLLAIARSHGRKTTGQFAGEIGVSQQTASRWLRSLQSEGLVEKTRTGFRLSAQATEIISNISKTAEEIKTSLELYGTVVSGLREGAFYMGLEGYKRQILRTLGFTPYPGTLNLRLESKTDLENAAKLRAMPGTKIFGFKDPAHGSRLFGAAKCFSARITCKNAHADCAVLMPDRTHHDSRVIEIISPDYLRAKLRLKNGSNARITIQTKEAV